MPRKSRASRAHVWHRVKGGVVMICRMRFVQPERIMEIPHSEKCRRCEAIEVSRHKPNNQPEQRN